MDRGDTERYRSLTRRTLVLGGMKLGLMGVLTARMYHLQVIESEKFHMLAEENRINMRLLAPSRGEIVDRFGVPLAVNNQNFQVVLVAEQAGDVAATLGKLSGIIPLGEEEIADVMRDVARRRAFVPVTVRENLTWDEVASIEVNAPALPGLSIEVGETRFYPFQESIAHVVGYVGAVAESDLTGDPVLTIPGFKIGKTGTERQHEEALRGKAGASQVEVNAVGRVIRELSRDEGEEGSRAQLTIDIGLQEFVARRLAVEQSASAVVMDVHNGEVYALSSSPGYDPNLFPKGISSVDWSRLLNDPYAPLTNKAIAGQYAPGSTFKMVVALAAMEEGIGPDYTAYCPGHMTLGNHRFHCWKRGGHGRVDMIDSLEQSCDVYFYDVSRKIGIDKIATMANRLGLGTELEFDLPGEQPGLMPTTAWKLANIGESWHQGETLIASIGQGFVLATPLQLATMTARLVNGGKAVRPRVTQHIGLPNDPANAVPPVPDIGLDPAALDSVVRGMVAVTEGSRGTARSAQIRVEGMEMGGKTGTSQVRRITAAERAAGVTSNEDLPWRRRDHALFVGFAPVHAPRYACSVVVEHGGGGSAVAAPIARDILQECQERDPGRQLLSLAEPGAGTTGSRDG
ncbi:MAG TPA: penicillin-binding protein 2 [Alphaproteobacteria bacterium]|nr:penicillin-binding protein 2 [Alphaproteobacteria bacterium]